MNKPIVLRTANIYLRFPEIMEEECIDLAEFLEDEHIVYEGATDIFIEKDKEIERLNNIIKTFEAYLDTVLYTYKKDELSEARTQLELAKDKLKELKEGRE